MRLETFLQRNAVERPDKVALVCDGRRLTYRQLDDAARRLASELSLLGVGRGDRVVVQLDNSVETVVAIYAIARAGAVFVLVNPAVKPEKLAFVLNDSGAVLLIASPHKANEFLRCHLETPALAAVIVTGSEDLVGATAVRIATWSELLERDPAQDRSQEPGIDLDLAAIIYTSGSTGRPKGVMMAHCNMVAAATSVIEYLGNNHSDVILNVLPLSFSYGLHQVLTAIQVGATVVLEKSFAYPHAVLQRMEAERATGLAIVPTIAALLLRLDLRGYRLDGLRYVTNAGAGLPVEHIRRLRAKLPQTELFLMYGLTECKRVSYLPPAELERRPDSVGKPMPNVEAWVVDEEGRRLPPGKVGELVVRGANVMRGYWNLPEQTDIALRPGPMPGERILHTGDLFRIDADGYLYFAGRRDDIIKTRGEKVSPAEVENVLYRLEGVEMAAVVGVPDPVLGSAIKAVVTLRDGIQLGANDVLRHCARYLEDFMLPKILEFRASMPRNEAGKIDKRQLIAQEK